jgi:hypothetical protein
MSAYRCWICWMAHLDLKILYMSFSVLNLLNCIFWLQTVKKKRCVGVSVLNLLNGSFRSQNLVYFISGIESVEICWICWICCNSKKKKVCRRICVESVELHILTSKAKKKDMSSHRHWNCWINHFLRPW